jgi:hypothetical protein
MLPQGSHVQVNGDIRTPQDEAALFGDKLFVVGQFPAELEQQLA